MGRPRYGLSARLLLLTVLFVFLAEILIYVPSLAQFRRNWLEERLGAAQIAALALEATSSRMVSEDLARDLLESAGVDAVVLQRGETRKLILGYDIHLDVAESYDLRTAPPWTLVGDAFLTFELDDNKLIQVTGSSRKSVGDYVQILIYPDDLKRAMINYSHQILLVSIAISLFSALLVYASLNVILVRPIRRITRRLLEFGEDPETTRPISVTTRNDEVGQAEKALQLMQSDLKSALRQKTRLANLGVAVSKINHDLRNILASAQLLSDRLASTDNPTVQTLAPRLMQAIDRAITLCNSTLTYGQAQERLPEFRYVDLKTAVDEVGLALGLTSHEKITWITAVPVEITVWADADHLHRVLLNLTRNAMQALLTTETEAANIAVSAMMDEDQVVIDVADTGPGLPLKTQEHLFEPFVGSTTAGGTGLGLAIAKELIEGHGGTITLLKSNSRGTTFRIHLPARAAG